MDIFRRPRQYDPVTLATIAVIGTAVSAGSSVMGGIEANKAAKAEANLQREQGDIAAREAQFNAENEAFSQTQSVQRQRLAFLSNGVSLEGSPLDVLAQSKKYGQSQVDAILRQGSAQKSLAYQSANITRNKGRAALTSGIMQGVGTGLQGAAMAGKAGMFDSKPVTTPTK